MIGRLLVGVLAVVGLAVVVVGGILYLREEDTSSSDYDATHRGRLHGHLHR